VPGGYSLLDRHGDFVELEFDQPLWIGDQSSPGGPDTVTSRASSLGTRLFGIDADKLIDETKRRLLEDPESANKILQSVLRNERLGFLSDLKLDVVVIDADEGQSTIGFIYDYARTLTPQAVAEGTVFSGWELDFFARGTVAVEPELNRSNFLETLLEYKYYRSTGGVRDDANVPPDEVLRRRVERGEALAGLGDDFRSSELFRKHSEEVRALMTPQFHMDVGFTGGLEGNQAFTQKNWTYGLQTVIDFKAWNPHSHAAKLNLFDLPFAIIRLLTGYDARWQVRGSTYPTVLLAIDQVNPQDNGIDEMLVDDESYTRFRGEASFRTPIAWFGTSQVFFGANYRYYQEFGASDAVKATGLDDHAFLTMSVTTDKGFLVTYKTGSLPFNVQDDSGFEVGWKFEL